MKLIRWRGAQSGPLRTGIEHNGEIYDLSGRFPTLRSFLEAHPKGWDAEAVGLGAFPKRPLDTVSLGAPVDDAAAIYLVGANYKKHAEEAGLSVPEIPVIFMKPVTALVGPDEPIVLPPVSRQMDYEGELAIVIGKPAARVAASDAAAHIAGVTVVNDVTARDLQWVQLGPNRIVDWLSSKCLDASTPVGPGIVPVNALGDLHRLKLKTWLNETLMQDADTSLMVFSIVERIAFLSARVTLRPGDLISTGTPYGVGGFRKIFLKHGDVLRVEIEGVGSLTNPVS